MTLIYFAGLFLYLYFGQSLHNQGYSVRSNFVSLYRDFSRKEFLRVKTFPIIMRSIFYLFFFWKVCQEVIILKHLLIITFLEVLGDLIYRVFDFHDPQTLSFHPKSFTLAFFLSRLNPKADFNFFYTVLYYTFLGQVLLWDQDFTVTLNLASSITFVRIMLLYCEERYKRDCQRYRETLKVEGERGFKMLRRAQRAGERHHVIVIA